MKKFTFVLALVLVAALFLMAAAPSFQALARLKVINNTDDTAILILDGKLDGDPVHYYLTVPEGTTTFTVERVKYKAKISMCGFFNQSASIDVRTNLKLNLKCDPSYKMMGTEDPLDDELNWGEPTQEKVYPEDILDKVSVSGWRFNY